MRVLVLLEVGADVRIPPQLDARSGRVREEWLVRQPDPASERALALALELAAGDPRAEVTVLHLGPADGEPWLRRALAAGAASAVRVWSAELEGIGAAGKALVLAEAARAAGFDLVLTGSRGVIDASGTLGVVLAEHLGVSCLTQVEALTRGADATPLLRLTRTLARGYRERVEAALPLVATVAPPPGEPTTPQAPSGSARLRAEAADIPVWDLADLGVPAARLREAEEALRAGPFVPVRPRLVPLAAPDPSLPVFDRILKLVEGSVKRREGRVVRQPAEQTVEQIFEALRAEGWLDHLRASSADPYAGEAT